MHLWVKCECMCVDSAGVVGGHGATLSVDQESDGSRRLLLHSESRMRIDMDVIGRN